MNLKENINKNNKKNNFRNKKLNKFLNKPFILSKKGDIQISISWIFMIIIGTVFIILAYNIISKYKSIEENKYNIELANSLRTSFNNVGLTSGISQNKLEPIKNVFKKSTVEIICENSMPILFINDNSYPNIQFFKTTPIFMSYIKQDTVDETFLAVENFKLPFKTTNLLAIVSKKNLIVFDNQSQITKDYINGKEGKFTQSAYRGLSFITRNFNSLSSNMQNFYNEIKDKNYNSIIFVSDNDSSIPNLNLNDIKILSHQLKIYQRPDKKGGTLIYIDKNNNNYKFNYIDYDQSLSLVTMAIFSRPETYNCSTNLILENTKSAYDFYIIKADYLKNQSLTYRTCSASLQNFEQEEKYEYIKEKLKEIRNKINESFNNNEIFILLNNLKQAQDDLEDFNCVYVY